MQKSVCVQRTVLSYENVPRHDSRARPAVRDARIRAARTKQKLSAMMLLHRRNDAESSESQVERLSYRAPHWLAGAAGSKLK
jgi:hypothetical protein